MYKDGRKLRAASGIHQISRLEVRMAERQHGQRWNGPWTRALIIRGFNVDAFRNETPVI